MDALLIDVGVLLSPGDHEFDAYNIVWDKAYGYYDELQSYAQMKDKEKLIEFAREYCREGVEGTYAIIATTQLHESSVSEALENADDKDSIFADLDVEGETYDAGAVIFSLCKRDGMLVEGFVRGKAG